MRTHRIIAPLTALVAILGLTQCSDETPRPTSPRPTGPLASEAQPGGQLTTVTIETTTGGSSLDPDGYSFTVTLDRSSVAANCTVWEPNSRAVSVTPGGTVTAAFEVTCSDVTTGSLTVTAATSGSDLDADGYTVTVDGNAATAHPVGVDGSTTFSNLSPGSHTVALSGLAANCATTDGPQTVAIAVGQTATATFSVVCQAIPGPEIGDLVVTTTTSGANIDPDGYSVTLDENPATVKSVGANGSVTFPGLSAGSHTVALSGLQSNCTVSDPNPQTGVVVAGGSVTVAFSVACQALGGNLTVNVSTGGTELDPDGYTVTLDGGVSRSVGINGSVTFDGIAAGSHTIALSGLAPTCSLLNNPRTVSVTLGQTTETALAVECTTLYTVVGAGDIAGCTWDGDEATAKLLDAVVASDPRATVFALGDIVYDSVSTGYNDCFHPTWGRHKSRMYAALGNKEYAVDANRTWDYFGDRAGARGVGYFSFDLGDYWHVVILNDNWAFGGPGGQAGSAQDQWLVADLAANKKPCTIAIWHQAYVASGWAVSTQRKNFWSRVYDAGGELVLSGHVHHYERFAPMTADLVRDDARGVREFVVGTGGVPPNGIGTRHANSEVAKGRTNGVLKLTLGARTYSWEFIPVPGTTFTDKGTGTCH